MKESNQTGNSKVIALVVVSVVVAGAGFYAFKYFQGKAKNPYAGTTVKVDGVDVHYGSDGESATITDPKTGAKMITGSDVKIPSSFPRDIPIYSNAKVKVVSLDYKYPFASIETKDDVKTVMAWYQNDLQKKGWTVTGSNMMSPDVATIQFENKVNMGNIMLAKSSEEEKGTIVNISTFSREEFQKQLKELTPQGTNSGAPAPNIEGGE